MNRIPKNVFNCIYFVNIKGRIASPERFGQSGMLSKTTETTFAAERRRAGWYGNAPGVNCDHLVLPGQEVTNQLMLLLTELDQSTAEHHYIDRRIFSIYSQSLWHYSYSWNANVGETDKINYTIRSHTNKPTVLLICRRIQIN